MNFTPTSELLNAVVLAVVSKDSQGTYGYKITQDVRQILDVSESTLYPVLRRLQSDKLLQTYDQEFNGRNRRYYKITDDGTQRLQEYKDGWKNFSSHISSILE